MSNYDYDSYDNDNYDNNKGDLISLPLAACGCLLVSVFCFPIHVHKLADSNLSVDYKFSALLKRDVSTLG